MDQELHKILKDLLALADAKAVENVRAGRGGPFAASLHVYDLAGGGMIDVAGPVGNAVLETGLASAHAEDRVIVPENIAALKAILQQVGAANAHVYLVSSGESCPACHAKLEILARNLLHDSLIAPGHFTVVYGATYEDTAEVAGFHDAPYHDDFQKPAGTGLIRQSFAGRSSLPDAVRAALDDVSSPAAVLMLDDRAITAQGPFPEVTAIQKASALQKENGMAEPWNLRGARLYSQTRQIGPLSYAECQWANVTQWITVDEPQVNNAVPTEAPGIANDILFSVVGTRPYNHPLSALQFIHLTPFENAAQHEWARADLRRYNGAEGF